MAQQGFSYDSIQNFEVVLVKGSIINADENLNANLWRALKGGGSDFGIVTCYDMEALNDTNIARGSRIMSGNYSTHLVDVVVEFTSSQERDNNDALVAILLHATGKMSWQ
jgi:hypothetical protein